jgi:hypothetical protein
MVLTLIFSRKQIQSLSIHDQTRVLNDVDEKLHKIAELTMQDPSLGKVIDNQGNSSRDLAFSFYVLWIFSHAHAMRHRNVLDDNEWTGWLRLMKSAFEQGKIKGIMGKQPGNRKIV